MFLKSSMSLFKAKNKRAKFKTMTTLICILEWQPSVVYEYEDIHNSKVDCTCIFENYQFEVKSHVKDKRTSVRGHVHLYKTRLNLADLGYWT